MAADRICWLLAAALLMLAVVAVSARAHAAEPTDWVPVSMNAGETYVINDIKPGTKPLFKVEQNPGAFVTYDSPPGKLTMLSAGAGRWIVTITTTSDRELSYDVNAFGAAKPGAPLMPGKAPPSMSDEGLDSRPGEGASISTSSAMPELETIPSLRTRPPVASPYSLTVPDKAPLSYDDASWNVPPQPDKSSHTYEPSQSVAPSATSAARYRNDPSVLDAGPGYLGDSVSGGKHYLPEEAVSLMIGTSEVIDFQHRITRISVADSKIADVQVIDPFQLNLIAHQPGFTTLAVWDADGQYNERTVRVDASGRQQVMLNTIVAELDRNELENQGV
ncbi:MAG TPA: pilus assembly protein N-terminal domain-containing protein, partial [Candidatus Limnocylindrales bacterium]|nr:pilus assembly protein N-terminal domain-containing protein [Candidatus Limnocylindrales bacterium]